MTLDVEAIEARLAKFGAALGKTAEADIRALLDEVKALREALEEISSLSAQAGGASPYLMGVQSRTYRIAREALVRAEARPPSDALLDAARELKRIDDECQRAGSITLTQQAAYDRAQDTLIRAALAAVDGQSQ